MDFTNAPGFNTVYYLILMIIWIAIMIGLVRSAMASLKRTQGKISSIFDEIIVGLIVTVGFIIFAMIPASTVISWLTKPLKFVWDLLMQLLRFVGLPF